MNKLALVSVLTHNYGSLLQTYALQKYLVANGYTNEVIMYKEKSLFRQFSRLLQPSFAKVKGKVLYRDVYIKYFQKVLKKGLTKRAEKFEEFKKEKLVFSKPFIGRESLINGIKQYDAAVLGSDQVLHPNNLKMDYFNLCFVPNEVPKITYAPSFGVSEIPANQKKKTKAYLERINYVSVREPSGQKIIKDLTNRDVPVVSDPTVLIDRTEWDKLKGDERFFKDKYIFCYFLGTNKLHRDFAIRLKQETGYKIVALQQLDEFVRGDLVFGDETPFSVGPAECVNLISNAEYVLTDSFHGTIFSNLYKKKFFTFYRYAENSFDSTNSRIKSILGQLNLEERRLDGNENIAEVLKMEIDCEKVYNRVQQMKDLSNEYISNALSSIKA